MRCGLVWQIDDQIQFLFFGDFHAKYKAKYPQTTLEILAFGNVKIKGITRASNDVNENNLLWF